MTPGELAQQLHAKRSGDGWVAKCPAHEDHRASLSIGTGDDGRVLLVCFAGCKLEEILAAARLEMADIFPPRETPAQAKPTIATTYDYTDEQGGLIFQVVRYVPKGFRQRKPDATAPDGWCWKVAGSRRVIYRLPDVLEADDSAPVFVCEGEKDADALARLGLCSTTSAGGASNWRQTAEEARKALVGRDVVILPDNDDPGRAYAEEVARSLAGVARSIRIVALPALELHGDASNWLAAGGDVPQLLAMVEKATPRSPSAAVSSAAKGELPAAAPAAAGFASSASRLEGEAARRRALVARKIAFGIRYFDDALDGILPNDLILVGAYTGVGKTQLVNLIARSAVAARKRPAIFALEAEPDEFERRIKYSALASAWYAANGADHPEAKRLSYRTWYLGQIDDLLGAYEADVDRRLAEELRGMATYYRGANFALEDLEREIRALEGRADLVVIDHLHYVDLADDESENRGYRGIVKRVRDLSLAAGVPVILVAHLRKRERGSKSPVPELDDIHGTSDVPKLVTKAIMLSSVPHTAGADKAPPFLWSTYMACPKHRADGSTSRYVALARFNARLGCYEDHYVLGRVFADKWAPTPKEHWPSWATGAVEPPKPKTDPAGAATHASRTEEAEREPQLELVR